MKSMSHLDSIRSHPQHVMNVVDICSFLGITTRNVQPIQEKPYRCICSLFSANFLFPFPTSNITTNSRIVNINTTSSQFVEDPIHMGKNCIPPFTFFYYASL